MHNVCNVWCDNDVFLFILNNTNKICILKEFIEWIFLGIGVSKCQLNNFLLRSAPLKMN